MIICVPRLSKEGWGGGWTFMANFKRGAEKLGHSFVDTDKLTRADVMFVANPMWAERDDFTRAKELKKRIVMRLDNIPEDWNNRGTAISKLRDFIPQCDEIIFQSRWAAGKYIEFMPEQEFENKGVVIHNGVDMEVFKPNGEKIKTSNSPILIYVKSGRNENKRYPEAMEIFRRYWQTNKNAELWLVGQFAENTKQYNFGFYNGEKFKYWGIGDHKLLSVLYRSADILLHPAYADAAPNVVLEAMASGCVPMINIYGGGVEFLYETVKTEINTITINNCGVGIDALDGIDYKSQINKALTIKPEHIIEHIKTYFNLGIMVEKYLKALNGKLI